MAQGTLILVRHGQSVWNLENRFTGWTDVPLTARGEAEARAAAEKLAGIHFDAAFCSALRRARRTLAIILAALDQTGEPEVICSEALNERHYGALQGLNKARTAEKLGLEVVTQWRRSYDIRPPEGESLADTRRRVVAYFEGAIRPRLCAGQNVLVVAHANSLRALVMALDGLGPEEVRSLTIPTGAPLCYTLDADGAITTRQYL